MMWFLTMLLTIVVVAKDTVYIRNRIKWCLANKKVYLSFVRYWTMNYKLCLCATLDLLGL